MKGYQFQFSDSHLYKNHFCLSCEAEADRSVALLEHLADWLNISFQAGLYSSSLQQHYNSTLFHISITRFLKVTK